MKESAVSGHLLQCDCTISFDHFDIVASATNSFRLLIAESLLIKRDISILNRAVKVISLETIWLICILLILFAILSGSYIQR